MKTTGIIAEYNPFHNGHKYHINKARQLSGCDYVIVVMSGDYTQRGTPAIYSKYQRAKTALLAGADLVLEMPVFGSISSAPDFAECGVNTLHRSGVCDYLCFGSEAGCVASLSEQADALMNESDAISDAIREGLRMGLSWPEARSSAYKSTAVLSSSPNDILAIEYIRALRRANAAIEPMTVKRNDPGYHSEEKAGCYASATAARKAILTEDCDFLSSVLPDEHFQTLSDDYIPPITFDDCSALLAEKLLTASPEQLSHISGMPGDLANKLYKNRLRFERADQLVSERKDRNYTYTRVNRCLINLMLGITKQDSSDFKQYDSVPWIRILGFRKDAAPLLSELKRHSASPIITKIANAESILDGTPLALFHKHLLAAERYRLLSELKSGHRIKNEYERSVIII